MCWSCLVFEASRVHNVKVVVRPLVVAANMEIF